MKVKCRIGNSSMVLEVTQNFMLRDIAVTHFKSKSITVDLDEYCFKVPNYDFFLELHQSINDLLEIAWVFQDRDVDDVVATIVLIRKAEKGDAIQRESLTIDPAQEAGLCIWAWKRGGSTGGILSGFKKRYFILQSNTLYYSESPGSPGLGYIPMSGSTSRIRTDIQYKDKVAFELINAANANRSWVLAADQIEFSQLHQALDELQLRRVKSAAVTLCQELLARDVSQMQGLFRISGEKSQVEYLKHQYDLALDPDLTELPNEVLSGVVKQFLRQLESPLIGFGLYNEYLRFGKMQPGPERTESMQNAIKRLPQTSRHFLHYLCLVLKAIATHSATNLMNSKNLAIVIGPNILRPQRETSQTAMNDNQYVLSAIQGLIDEVDAVFGPSPALKVPDTPVTKEAAQTLARHRASVVVQSPQSSEYMRSRQSRMSISEIDPSLAFVQDLKSVMTSSKTVGSKITELATKHEQVMSKWNDLLVAIKTNPQSTLGMSEFILNQSEIDTRWIDSGLQSLDQVYSNLSDLVALLRPDLEPNFPAPPPPSTAVPPTPTYPTPPISPRAGLHTPGNSGMYPAFSANLPPGSKLPPPPPTKVNPNANPSGQWFPPPSPAHVALPSAPSAPSAPPPPSSAPERFSVNSNDVPPPPPPDDY